MRVDVNQKIVAACLAACLGAAPAAAQPHGKLDLDYFGPQPTLTLANGIFIPGGGWFYMANCDGGRATDFLWGAAALSSILFLLFQVDQNTRSGRLDNLTPIIIAGVTIRYFDVTVSVSESLDRQRTVSSPAPAEETKSSAAPDTYRWLLSFKVEDIMPKFGDIAEQRRKEIVDHILKTKGHTEVRRGLFGARTYFVIDKNLSPAEHEKIQKILRWEAGAYAIE